MQSQALHCLSVAWQTGATRIGNSVVAWCALEPDANKLFGVYQSCFILADLLPDVLTMLCARSFFGGGCVPNTVADDNHRSLRPSPSSFRESQLHHKLAICCTGNTATYYARLFPGGSLHRCYVLTCRAACLRILITCLHRRLWADS